MIYVGCCGFSISRRRYYNTFNVVELQETFYDLPNPERLRGLKSEAPANFVFTMKCWQAVTHPLDSPTWRKSRFIPNTSLRDRYGFLRPTKEVFESWELTIEAAKTLNAKAIIVQTPPSFSYNEDNYRNAFNFFSAVSSSNFIIGWEPRGTWLENQEKITELVGKFRNLVHVVDPLKQKPSPHKDVSYFRLHGLGGEVNYRYKYNDNDLKTLCTVVEKLTRECSEIYVMFNNVYMAQDALRFKQNCYVNHL
ncbi:MAG: DUF72 domain-containing protein [Sulfolobales archaeon]|nr:DUF72 domain-containing protein [Sulfolobales archaeon]